MTANELKDHLRDVMRRPSPEIADHLREMGHEGFLPTQKQALVKLHADLHGTAKLVGSETTDAPAPEPTPAKRPAPKAPAAKAPAKSAPKAPARKPAVKAPARRTAPKAPAAKTAPKAPPARRTRASATPGTPATPPRRRAASKAPAAKASPKAPARTSAKTAPAPAANGSGTANATKHDLARRLIDMVAEWAKDESPENKAKLAYWLHGLPTGYPNGGGGGYLRYWPKGLPKPTTAGWRPPAAK